VEVKMGHDNNKMGLFSGIGFLASGMIGSAIYSLSGITIYAAGPASLLSWFAAALVMMGFGLVTSELSVTSEAIKAAVKDCITQATIKNEKE
jgi:amino acid transporter